MTVVVPTYVLAPESVQVPVPLFVNATVGLLPAPFPEMITVTPVPRLSVVLPLPALLNVAVSPVPGGPPAVQLVAVDQVELSVPIHVALAAGAEGATSFSVCAGALESVGAVADDESKISVAV